MFAGAKRLIGLSQTNKMIDLFKLVAVYILVMTVAVIAGLEAHKTYVPPNPKEMRTPSNKEIEEVMDYLHQDDDQDDERDNGWDLK
jgi:hypothetical protein